MITSTRFIKFPGFHLCIFITVCLFFSCKKVSNDTSEEVAPDFKTLVTASVSGFVTDENDEAVIGAEVHYGSKTTTTGKYGFFEIQSAEVVKNAAVVTIMKQGYFKGIKTFITSANRSSFCRAKLIPKIIVGTINSTTGGSVSLKDGLKITLPSNSVVNTATKQSYTGSINISCYWIDPTSNDSYKEMPGNLWGLDKKDAIKALQSFGMAAIELTGTNGELLQIGEGLKATLSMKIPDQLLPDAPSAIPLWYFDEVNGHWKEEGMGTKNGNYYTGEVTHFSFWNYDNYLSAVKFTCRVTDTQGNPLRGQSVIFSNKTIFCKDYFFTDDNGYVSGFIPISTYLLKVAGEDYCSMYSRSVSLPTQLPYDGINEPVYEFPDVVIPPSSIARISGNAVDCNGKPISYGYIIIVNPYGGYEKVSFDSTGGFSFIETFCKAGQSISLIAESTAVLQQSVGLNITLDSGNISIGTLRACNLSVEQYIDYTVDGTRYSFNYPECYLGNDYNYINAYYHTSSSITKWVSFVHEPQSNITAGSNLPLQLFKYQFPGDTLEIESPAIMVHFTNYGSVGGFISGNFSGTATSSKPAGELHTITCSFRLRRNN